MNLKISLLFLSVTFLFSCSAESNKQEKLRINYMLEKDKVIKVVNNLFIETDNRNWENVKASFTDSVNFDMTSLIGGEPSTISAQDIVDAWEKGLKDLEAIHHQVGNYIVEVKGTEATVFCYGIASHFLPNKTGNNVRTFVGSYDFNLVKKNSSWKIDKFKFNFKYLDGNSELEKS